MEQIYFRKRKFGCEYCDGTSGRIMSAPGAGWINATLWLKKEKDDFLNKETWKLKLQEKDFDTGERTDIAYIEPKFCWNCGRKLK